MCSIKRNILAVAALLLICACMSVPKAFAQKASLNVEPQEGVISNIGEELTVNITIKDLPSPGMFGYELKLYFDTTYLNATKAEIPSGHFMTPTDPTKIFIVDPGTINNTLGRVSFALTLLAPEGGKTGTGILCKVTFQGKAVGVSPLTFTDVILVDPDAVEIPKANYDINDGQITVIPEFSTVLMVLLFLVVTVSAIMLKKKALPKMKKTSLDVNRRN